MEKLSILGVDVDSVTRADLLATVTAWARGTEPRTISYVNAHCLNLAAQDSAYRSLLNQADLVYSDGRSVVWASQLLGGPRMHKITGRDWIHDLCRCAESDGLSLYILAGRPGIAESARRNLLKDWPGLKIVGCSDGYFITKSEAVVLDELAAEPPHILLVGMGAPLQEKWIARWRTNLASPVCWAVGALFDYVAGEEAPVPSWMDRIGLEWMWRLMIDPLGKWRRYLIGNPFFVARVIGQKMHLRR